MSDYLQYIGNVPEGWVRKAGSLRECGEVDRGPDGPVGPTGAAGSEAVAEEVWAFVGAMHAHATHGERCRVQDKPRNVPREHAITCLPTLVRGATTILTNSMIALWKLRVRHQKDLDQAVVHIGKFDTKAHLDDNQAARRGAAGVTRSSAMQ